MATHLEILVDSNNSSRSERQRKEMGKREPVPELGEEGHPNDRRHVVVARLVLHRNRDVPSPGVDDSLRDGRTKLGHGSFVLVSHDLFENLSNRGDFRVDGFVLLYENHGKRDAGSLANKVDGVLGKWLEKSDSILNEGRGQQSVFDLLRVQGLHKLTSRPVPAHEIPNAIAAPYLTLGL